MICYKCGSALGSGGRCLHCGADVALYKKIVRSSNECYNLGLAKARQRNLSGAAADLMRALEFDKKNYKARNLLGLVLFEMGEIVDALSQWVISSQLTPENNPAQEYLNRVRDDRAMLDTVNSAVRGFNQALDHATHGSEDLAVIQLRRSISQHPGFLKAYQLLALLLLKEGDNAKALKIIKTGLSIDHGNILLLSYENEARSASGKPHKNKKDLLEKTISLAGEEVIIPHYTERSRIKQMLIGAAAAVAVMLSTYFFLIKPSVDRDVNNTLNQNEISYYEKTEGREAQIRELTTELDGLREEASKNRELIETYTGEDGSITNYERVLTALVQYWNKDYKAFITTYGKINSEAITSEAFVSAYNRLGSLIGSNSMLSSIMDDAVKYFNNYRFSDCQSVCLECLKLNPDYEKAIYYMGLCYEAQGDDAAAAPYFKQIVEKFPSGEYYELAKKRVS